MTWGAKPTGRRGRQPVCRDAAVQTCLTMMVLFGLALRQTTGFVESLLHLISPDWEFPDFSTLSRRQKTLKVNIPYRGSAGPLHLLIHSTGIKVEGEAEWNARKPGGSKRRVWRKIHIGIDEKTLEIRAAEFTTSAAGDAPMRPELPDQIPPDPAIGSVPADGAFATRKGQAAIAERGAAAIIPPRKTAKPWKTDTAGALAATRPCARHAASAARSGDDGAAITAKTVSRVQDALCETAGPTPHGRAGLRPSGRGVPGPSCRPERRHRARPTRH